MNRRRIQPTPTLKLETVSLWLLVQLVRAVDQYAKHLGGRTDPTHVIAQVIEMALAQDADFQKTLTSRVTGPAASAVRATA